MSHTRGSLRRTRQRGDGNVRCLLTVTATKKRGLVAVVPLIALLLAVGVSAYRSFDPAISGDYAAHLDYLLYLEHHHSLPRADQGFEMYHPPVYYVVSVIAFELVRPVHRSFTLTDAGRIVATTAWFLEGLLAAAIVARLRGNWLGIATAAGGTWLLPGQANVATRLYPETMAGLGVALLVLGLVNLDQDRRSGYAWLAVGVPLAALAKYSGLVALAVALPLAIWTARRSLRQLLLALAPGLVLVVAFYARNVLLFGTPTPLNADLFHIDSLGGLYAHYPPGFFTHISLGRCAAAHSFYGSAWKWLWATDCGVKPPFRDRVGGWFFLAAVAATVLAVAGIVWAATRSRRSMGWASVALIPAGVLAAFVYYNLRVPSGSSGLYLLVAIVPVAVGTGGLATAWLVKDRSQIAGYLALLGWAAFMAHAAGVG